MGKLPCILVRATKRGWPSTAKVSEFTGKRVFLHIYTLENKLGRALREGYETHHNCFVRHCIEPSHLEEVTHRDNHILSMGRRRATRISRLEGSNV